MSELHIESEVRDGCLRLRLEGVLDGGGAYLLRDRIAQCGDDAVVVDFSRLQRLSDFGLGILAMGLGDHPGEVQLTGLGSHALRILRAFGVANAA
jgi:anti-anti-sigma regulatory factor